MAKSIIIEVAKIGVEIQTDNLEFLNLLEKTYRSFLIPSSYPVPLKKAGWVRGHFVLKVDTESNKGFLKPSVFQDNFTNNLWEISTTLYRSVLNFSTMQGELILNLNHVLNGMGNLLRNLYSYLIIQKGGLLIHSCGVVKNGRAYLFFGPSKSGKSTVASLSKEYLILSDDLIPIMEDEGRFKAFRTPCFGDRKSYPPLVGSNRNNAFPIAGIFQLIKDKETYFERMGHSEAISQLYTRPNYPLGIKKLSQMLDLFVRVCFSIPCHQMHFRKDNTFWEKIEELGI